MQRRVLAGMVYTRVCVLGCGGGADSAGGGRSSMAILLKSSFLGPLPLASRFPICPLSRIRTRDADSERGGQTRSPTLRDTGGLGVGAATGAGTTGSSSAFRWRGSRSTRSGTVRSARHRCGAMTCCKPTSDSFSAATPSAPAPQNPPPLVLITIVRVLVLVVVVVVFGR
eukprot:3371311-Rhodomonas_salina.5